MELPLGQAHGAVFKIVPFLWNFFKNGPNKLECYITLVHKRSILFDPFVSYAENGVLWNRPLALPTNLSPGWKGLPVAKTLAYFPATSVTNKEKFFYRIDTRMNFSRSKSSLPSDAVTLSSAFLSESAGCLIDLKSCGQTILYYLFVRNCSAETFASMILKIDF